MARQGLRVIDLTPTVEAAMKHRTDWHWYSFVARLRDFVPDVGLTFDWDSGAGESWARVLNGKQPIALVWTKIPFAFVDPRASALNRFLRDAGVYLVELSDFDAPVLKLDLKRTAGLLEPDKWPDVLPANRMSASDLWWATV